MYLIRLKDVLQEITIESRDSLGLDATFEEPLFCKNPAIDSPWGIDPIDPIEVSIDRMFHIVWECVFAYIQQCTDCSITRNHNEISRIRPDLYGR